MTVVGDVLGRRDVEQIARAHVEALPESLVSRIGGRYPQAFYRYLAGSADELILIDRGAPGADLRAACIVSLAPATLSRRLLYRTPLAFHALRAVRRLPLRALVTSRAAGSPAEAPPPSPQGLHRGASGRDGSRPSAGRSLEGPEILLLFAVPEARGHGVGARLLERCEALLVERGFDGLWVKTRDDPGNRAIQFYRREGFAPAGSVSRHGKRLARFHKPLRPPG